MKTWEQVFARLIQETGEADAAHDAAHIRRVVSNARALAESENGQLEVILPAAWLHDCVTVPKNSPQRSQASQLSADQAGIWLRQSGYPEEYIPGIMHAIAAHSFSAQIETQSLEAQIVQDADRLDAIGAIGIARCFAVGGALGIELYDAADPFAENRSPDESANSVDHFFVKLLKLANSMKTSAGREEALRRTAFMHRYLDELRREIRA
jgi:uncharacterized protein